MSMPLIDLSTAQLRCCVAVTPELALAAHGLADIPCGLASSALFAVELAGQRLTARSSELTVTQHHVDQSVAGRQLLCVDLAQAESGLTIRYCLASYAETALIESWVELQNHGTAPLSISRIDSLVFDLPQGEYTCLSLTGSWGLEFEPHQTPCDQDIILESRSGRSSHGHHPWFALTYGGQALLSGAVAWSGNWVMRLLHTEAGMQFSAGLHDWEFSLNLAPGATFTAPPCVLALAAGADLNAISSQYTLVGRRFWYPPSALAERLPVEWNHWWSYEDKDLSEAAFRANVDVAAHLGMEVCTLDAGWFGANDSSTHWYEQRGDWDLINTIRFPSGIRALSDYVHERGMAFGLWCEIEAIGKQARLASTHPELVASRDATPLGYVCLGSPAGRAWALETLERLVAAYQCDWIKLDFNLDPGAGCNRDDHGHGAGDGLAAHYAGYYALLAELRQRHPDLVLENCSSGGLRIDLGLARQTHMAFLSDPDWPEHSLQCFWGASLMLAPDALLHWGYCEWSHAEHRYQHFNPRDPALQQHQIDYYTHISMLRRFGFSQRLPDLPDWVAERYRQLIATYKTTVRRFVQHATLLRLSEQPKRFGAGARWVAFQYSLPASDEHLLAVFCLPGAVPAYQVQLQGLVAEQTYTLTWLDQQQQRTLTGHALGTEGLQFAMQAETSAMILIRNIG